MPLNVLYESPVGFALFSVLDEGKFKEVSDVQSIFSDPSSLSGVLQLKKFKKFTDQVEATGAAVALTEGLFRNNIKILKFKISRKNCQALEENAEKVGRRRGPGSAGSRRFKIGWNYSRM